MLCRVLLLLTPFLLVALLPFYARTVRIDLLKHHTADCLGDGDIVKQHIHKLLEPHTIPTITATPESVPHQSESVDKLAHLESALLELEHKVRVALDDRPKLPPFEAPLAVDVDDVDDDVDVVVVVVVAPPIPIPIPTPPTPPPIKTTCEDLNFVSNDQFDSWFEVALKRIKANQIVIDSGLANFGLDLLLTNPSSQTPDSNDLFASLTQSLRQEIEQKLATSMTTTTEKFIPDLIHKLPKNECENRSKEQLEELFSSKLEAVLSNSQRNTTNYADPKMGGFFIDYLSSGVPCQQLVASPPITSSHSNSKFPLTTRLINTMRKIASYFINEANGNFISEHITALRSKPVNGGVLDLAGGVLRDDISPFAERMEGSKGGHRDSIANFLRLHTHGGYCVAVGKKKITHAAAIGFSTGVFLNSAKVYFDRTNELCKRGDLGGLKVKIHAVSRQGVLGLNIDNNNNGYELQLPEEFKYSKVARSKTLLFSGPVEVDEFDVMVFEPGLDSFNFEKEEEGGEFYEDEEGEGEGGGKGKGKGKEKIYEGKNFPMRVIIFEFENENENECVALARIQAFGEGIGSEEDEKIILNRLFI